MMVCQQVRTRPMGLVVLALMAEFAASSNPRLASWYGPDCGDEASADLVIPLPVGPINEGECIASSEASVKLSCSSGSKVLTYYADTTCGFAFVPMDLSDSDAESLGDGQCVLGYPDYLMHVQIFDASDNDLVCSSGEGSVSTTAGQSVPGTERFAVWFGVCSDESAAYTVIPLDGAINEGDCIGDSSSQTSQSLKLDCSSGSRVLTMYQDNSCTIPVAPMPLSADQAEDVADGACVLGYPDYYAHIQILDGSDNDLVCGGALASTTQESVSGPRIAMWMGMVGSGCGDESSAVQVDPLFDGAVHENQCLSDSEGGASMMLTCTADTMVITGYSDDSCTPNQADDQAMVLTHTQAEDLATGDCVTLMEESGMGFYMQVLDAPDFEFVCSASTTMQSGTGASTTQEESGTISGPRIAMWMGSDCGDESSAMQVGSVPEDGFEEGQCAADPMEAGQTLMLTCSAETVALVGYGVDDTCSPDQSSGPVMELSHDDAEALANGECVMTMDLGANGVYMQILDAPDFQFACSAATTTGASTTELEESITTQSASTTASASTTEAAATSTAAATTTAAVTTTTTTAGATIEGSISMEGNYDSNNAASTYGDAVKAALAAVVHVQFPGANIQITQMSFGSSRRLTGRRTAAVSKTLNTEYTIDADDDNSLESIQEKLLSIGESSSSASQDFIDTFNTEAQAVDALASVTETPTVEAEVTSYNSAYSRAPATLLAVAVIFGLGGLN